MKLRGCSTSHFIWSIKDGNVKKVHNIDSHGRPGLRFKRLEDIIRSADGEDTRKYWDDYDGMVSYGNRSANEQTCLPFADRRTRARDGYIIEDEEPECPSDENCSEEMTLTQLKKKCKTKKRKASESVLLTPKAEDDDSDLSEPLCKFRVKVSKRSQMIPAKGRPSRSTQSATSELSMSTIDAPQCSKDLATVIVKVETPQVEYFEPGDTTNMGDEPLICNEPVGFSASESGFGHANHELKSRNSGPFINEAVVCGFNEASLDSLDLIKSSHDPPLGGENMKLDNEGNMEIDLLLPVSEVNKEEYVHQSLSILSSLEVVSPVADPTASTIPEQVSYISGVQDSDSTIDHDHCCVDLGQVSDSYMVEYAEGSPTDKEYTSPILLPWKSYYWSSPDDDDDAPIPEENQPLTSLNADVGTNSLNSDDNSFVYKSTSIHQEKLHADSEVKFSNDNYQTDKISDASEITNSDCTELRHPERLPLTRKTISPTSQEKLCLAMKSAELLDDMGPYKCNETLFFGEQAENKPSSTRSDDVDYEPNVNPRQATQLIQNKVAVSPKQMLKKPKNYKKGSPPKRCFPPKGCLDGARLCRSLPRLSTGCTSIQGCSESAITFSQRQMHDIESLALKLMTELNSMKVIVEEKLLYEAYRSTSLKNEADEVKSAIKSAAKTEETARKWLSMMARDCNRFCKIMKLKQDSNASVSADAASGSTIQEKPLQREGKKITFADEAGGTLCDVKVFENDAASLELAETLESLTNRSS